MIDTIILFFASLFANTMSAFAGGGSGLVQLPALLLLGLPFAKALATHKAANFMLGAGSMARNINNKDVSWSFSGYIIASGMLGTIVGVYIILNIPEHIAQNTLGILTISLGLYSLYKRDVGQKLQPRNRDMKGYIIGGIALFLTGMFNGSFSSGSGLFVTLLLIIWFGLDYKLAVIYTLALVGFFWNLTGAVSIYLMGGDIQWGWLPVLWIASFGGGYFGAHLGHLKGNLWIKRIFVTVAIASGVSLLLK